MSLVLQIGMIVQRDKNAITQGYDLTRIPLRRKRCFFFFLYFSLLSHLFTLFWKSSSLVYLHFMKCICILKPLLFSLSTGGILCMVFILYIILNAFGALVVWSRVVCIVDTMLLRQLRQTGKFRISREIQRYWSTPSAAKKDKFPTN